MIGTVRSIAYAMEETDIEKRQQMYEIADCAKDLIRFSKNIGESDYKDLVSVKDLVEDIVAENDAIIKSKGVHINIAYDGEIPDTILASEYKLRGKLLGLIIEAVSHTANSTITIAIELEFYNANEIAISFELKGSDYVNQQLCIFKQRHQNSSGCKIQQD